MKVIVKKDYDEVSKEAYKYIKAVVTDKPNAVLGLATGSTPIGLYKNMIADNANVSYARVSTINLDEYIGLDANDNQSYVYFMGDKLFNHIDINKANTNFPNGKAVDPQKECDKYNQKLKGLQQDLQILGLGSNGHIAFNEPGTPLDEVTHVVDLTESTINDNARLFFNGDRSRVPTKAITMGISNIMNAKRIVMIATGTGKADAVKAMIEGPVTSDCPASVLQNHKDVIVILDEAAASKLNA